MQRLHPQTLEFLQALDDFNEKKYFDLYKPLYLNIKEEFEKFIQALIDTISSIDENFKGLQAKSCTYRIYKDMRRPRNRKRPYKINMGANIAPGGKKSPYAGYYLHIENKKNFLACGIWKPRAKYSYAIREQIYTQRDEFKKILEDRNIKQEFGILTTTQESLKKGNRKSQYSQILGEIPDNHPSLKYLVMKDWLFTKPLSDDLVQADDFLSHCAEYMQIGNKFVQFINDSL